MYKTITILLLLSLLSTPANAEDIIDNSFEQSLGFKFSLKDGSRIARTLNTKNNGQSTDYPRTVRSVFDYFDARETRSMYFRPPSAPIKGTRNWEKAVHGPSFFTRRNGQATCVFKCPAGIYSGSDCIWLVGGRSEEYQAYDLEFTHRNADVWFSPSGHKWTQLETLEGDYVDGVGSFNANFPAKRPIAPWYSRYGHSLTAMDADGDGNDDAMVMMGGYSPEPSNDVWITTDGNEWVFDQYAPWPARAWHSSVVFKGQVYVVGGAPLTNDVWVGTLVPRAGFEGLSFANATTNEPIAVDPRRLTMKFEMKQPYMSEDVPFSPRSGHCMMTQIRRNDYNETTDIKDPGSKTDRMFLVGGFASWPVTDERYDGERSRNDIYSSEDGSNWIKLEPPLDELNKQPLSMPWAARSWHGCATFHHPDDRSVDVSQASHFAVSKDGFDANEVLHPRMFIVGGGYMGKKGNHIVRRMEAYVDAWWSRDGLDWTQVSYKERYGPALYTTQEWAGTTVEDAPINIGKWGFTLLPFKKEEDLDGSGIINDDWQDYNENGIEDEGESLLVSYDFAGNTLPDGWVEGTSEVEPNTEEAGFWRACSKEIILPDANLTDVTCSEREIPALLLIAGDTVDSGGLVNDVFISQSGLLCEKEGITCTDHGVCGPGTMGCICTSRQWIGEFCDTLNSEFQAGVGMLRPVLALWAVLGVAVFTLL